MNRIKRELKMTERETRKFHSFYDKNENGCWIWQRTTTGKGYPVISVGGGQQYAHHVSFSHFNGNIEEGKQVCHHCDNPACVNPTHLFLGDQSKNNEDSYKKDRGGKAKLTVQQVKEIKGRLNNGEQPAFLAKEYEVCRYTIYEIQTGRSWSFL